MVRGVITDVKDEFLITEKEKLEKLGLTVNADIFYLNRSKRQNAVIKGMIDYIDDVFKDTIDSMNANLFDTFRFTCIDEDMNVWQWKNNYGYTTCVKGSIQID
jgi:hypothetical protein